MRREEANEEVRSGAIGALGAWQACLASVPEPLAQRFCQGVAEKEPYRRAHFLLLVKFSTATIELMCLFCF